MADDPPLVRTTAWNATFNQNGDGRELPTQIAWFRHRVRGHGVDLEAVGPTESGGLGVIYRTEPAGGDLIAFGEDGADENAIIAEYRGMIAKEWSPGPLTARGVAADETHGVEREIGVEWEIEPAWIHELGLATPPLAESAVEAFFERVDETASAWEGDNPTDGAHL